MPEIYKVVSANLGTDKSQGHGDSTNFKLYFENLDDMILREGTTSLILK